MGTARGWRINVRYDPNRESMAAFMQGGEITRAVTDIAEKMLPIAVAAGPDERRGRAIEAVLHNDRTFGTYRSEFEITTEVIPDMPGHRLKGEPLPRIAAKLANNHPLATLIEAGSSNSKRYAPLHKALDFAVSIAGANSLDFDITDVQDDDPGADDWGAR